MNLLLQLATSQLCVCGWSGGQGSAKGVILTCPDLRGKERKEGRGVSSDIEVNGELR